MKPHEVSDFDLVTNGTPALVNGCLVAVTARTSGSRVVPGVVRLHAIRLVQQELESGVLHTRIQWSMDGPGGSWVNEYVLMLHRTSPAYGQVKVFGHHVPDEAWRLPNGKVRTGVNYELTFTRPIVVGEAAEVPVLRERARMAEAKLAAFVGKLADIVRSERP